MAGGVFDAFQRGVETSRQRRFQDEARIEAEAERAYRDSRRAAVDPAQDRLLAAQVSGAEFNVENQPLVREQLKTGLRRDKAGAGLTEFQLERAPRLAQQQDTAFATQQEQAGLNMTLARSGESRAQARHGVDMETARRQQSVAGLQFDAAKAEKERQDALAAWGTERYGIFQAASRNPEAAIARLNELYAKSVTDGNDDAGIRWNGQQFEVLTPDGSAVQQVIGGPMELLQFVDIYLSNPQVFAQSVEKQIAAANAKAKMEADAAAKQSVEDRKDRRAALTVAGADYEVKPGEISSIMEQLRPPKSLPGGVQLPAGVTKLEDLRSAPDSPGAGNPIPTFNLQTLANSEPGSITDQYYDLTHGPGQAAIARALMQSQK